MKPVLTKTTDKAVRQRHLIVLAYLILLVGASYIASSIPLFLYFHRSWWLIASHAVDGVIIIVLFGYLYKTHLASAVMWAMCVIDVIAIVPLTFDGGIKNTGILTVTGALLVVFLLKGRAGLKFWLATAYAAYLAAFELDLAGIIKLPYDHAQYLYFLIMEALAIMLLWLYGAEKERLDRDLTARTHELEVEKVSVERKVRERTHELAESRATLNSTVQSLHTIGLIMVDADKDIVFKNEAASIVLGYQKIHWTLEDFARDVHGMSNLLADCDKVLSTRRVITLSEATFKDGNFLRIGLNPVFAEHEVIGVVLSIQDITEQKILERSKDEFFSIASHELRTPLTAIRGNMSMVKDYFPEAMKDDGLAAMVNDTHDASIRLIAIVNDFLDSSRLEQGKMLFDLKPVSVKPLVEAVVHDLESILKEHGNTVKLEGFAQIPAVLADESRMRQILYNLLSNAGKYSDHGTISVSVDHDDKVVSICVTDTGKGISPENQKLLFHKFQQAGDPLTRDDTKGTGFGLYIAKLLATNMHGDVLLEHSDEGEGSTFKLVLPRTKE